MQPQLLKEFRITKALHIDPTSDRRFPLN